MGEPKTLPERLKQAREFAGLSLGQAAQLTGATRARLVAFENGSAVPGDAAVKVMAQYYDVTVTWLRGANPQLPRRINNALKNLSDEDADGIRTLLQSMDRNEHAKR